MENSPFKKGFTLIELMIVIVILGVLMGTILPRLTGAQARARDTGRIADLNTISQALETYYDDTGSYPGVAGTRYCLGLATETVVTPLLAGYLKGGKVPTPPSTGQVSTIDASVSGANTCEGAYLYAPLANRGLPKNGYLIASDMETWQNANFDADATPPTLSATSDVTQYSAKITDLTAEDATNAMFSAYLVVN